MSTELSKDEIAGYFNRHCAPLYMHIKKGEEEHHYVFSAFVISIDDEWFLVTAGHCFHEINEATDADYSILKANVLSLLA